MTPAELAARIDWCDRHDVRRGDPRCGACNPCLLRAELLGQRAVMVGGRWVFVPEGTAIEDVEVPDEAPTNGREHPLGWSPMPPAS